MSMLMRIIVITLGLSAAGFVAGGVVGMVMMAGWLLVDGDFSMDMVLFGGAFGAAMGAVLGPVSAWLLMRRVPIWLAITGTAGGTIAGAIFGGLIGGFGASLVCALFGFGSAALFLWRQEMDQRRAIQPPPHTPALRG
jgi:hypothetical protein